MKKLFGILTIALLVATGFTSCKKDSTSGDAKAYLVKTISFYAGWAGGTQAYEFAYNVNKKITGFDRTWDGGADGVFVYDYTVNGKLSVTKDGAAYATYDINAQGYITKEDWGGGEYATWEYDANGYCIRYNEFWGGVNHKKYEMVITNGNITKWTTFDDDGTTVKKIKEFFYSAGKNVNGLHQANSIDSDWKSAFYGKPSANLLDHFDYWDPRVVGFVKSTSTFTYQFDTKDRPILATKTLTDLSTEVWGYTYYEE
jgi:hypothetical protein